MNTWGYLLLIAALLLLAGVMLYARFSTRSREKSLHHAPVDWEFSPTVISSAPFAGGSEPIAPLPSSDVEIESEPVLRLERPAPASPVAEASRDRDYLDDLQEAAAGLAKLMRSSPVARVEPVVFAPEESPTEIAEALEEIVAEEVVAEEVVAEEIVAEEILPAVAPVEAPKVVSLRELLGDAVADQFDRIDEGLDALESLVTGIETSLRLLADLERPDLGDETYEGDEESVAAAA